MAAAIRHGYYWPTVCGGQCECGTCWVLIEECAPARAAEREVLTRSLRDPQAGARLGCQLTFDGPVTVHRRGIRAEVPVRRRVNLGLDDAT
jgi:2Fe-2S ferredoxin